MRGDIKKLKEARDKILPEAQFWNRNRLFLAWAFCAAIILTTGIEIVKIFTKNYYLIGMIALFLFGIFLVWKISKIIDDKSDDVNRTYEILNEEIKRLENNK